MTTLSALERIARLMQVCPACKGTGQQPMSLCQTCLGSGQVAAIPGLLRPCPLLPMTSDEVQRSNHNDLSWLPTALKRTKHPKSCNCGGTGSVLVSEAEALDKMLDWCYQNYIVVQQAQRDAPQRWGVRAHARWFYADTLAAAILQAQEVKI